VKNKEESGWGRRWNWIWTFVFINKMFK